MANYYETMGLVGTSFAGVRLMASGKIGGHRSVFVNVEGVKNDLTFPNFGGQLMNPFKVPAKIYAGDLFELRADDKGENPKVYLLKTFEVAKASSSETSFMVVRDGYHHIPCVGDVLMKAPDEIGGTGAAYAVTAVEATTDSEKNVWKITVGTTLGELEVGDVIVEAESANASGKMLVKAINGVAPCDYDLLITPMGTFAEGTPNEVSIDIAPALHGTMYKHKMSPIPPCVDKLNKSRINGWYEV
jgi:hypothetical protein